MKRLLIVTAVVVVLCIAVFAAVYSSDLLPSVTGYNLGNTSQRWNGYLQNLNISGTCIYHGVACFTSSNEVVSTGGVYGPQSCSEFGSTYVVIGVDSDGNFVCAPPADEPVDIGVTYNGTPTASLVIVRHPFPFAATIPADCTHSNLIAETAANAETVFSLQKCTAVGSCTEFGTATFASSGTSATFACTSATSFAEGEYIKVIAPASPDANIALIGGGIYGTRAGGTQ